MLDCVAYVVLMVELVVMCCRCDDVVHGGISGGLEEGVPRALRVCRGHGGGDVCMFMCLCCVVPLLV